MSIIIISENSAMTKLFDRLCHEIYLSEPLSVFSNWGGGIPFEYKHFRVKTINVFYTSSVIVAYLFYTYTGTTI